MSRLGKFAAIAALSAAVLFSLGASVRADPRQDLYSDFQGFTAASTNEEPEPTGNSAQKPRNNSSAPSTAPTDPEQPADPERPAARLLLDEKFGGGSLDTSIWNYCHWWNAGGCTIASNNELQWYTPGQVSVADGALRLTVERKDTAGADGKVFSYASGMVTTGPQQHRQRPKLAFTYGLVDVRFKVPTGQGLWPAIWLLPASERSVPEIDMMEILGQDTGNLRMKLHPADRSANLVGRKYQLPEGYGFADAWHTISLDWRPHKMVIYLDNRKVWEVHGEVVPDEPMYLVMNLAVGGEYPGPPTASTVFPATFYIDRVRIASYE